MIISAVVMSKNPSYRLPMQCAKVASFYDDTESLIAKYPTCQDPNAWVAVQGDMSGESAENIASALSLGFSMAIWLALAIHAIGIEIYVSSIAKPFPNDDLTRIHSFT